MIQYTDQGLLRLGLLPLERRPVHAVDPRVEAARVAEVVTGAVAAPQRRSGRGAVHALLHLAHAGHA